ncbi:hypothetical protein B0H10DRAFT_1969190 [Mycena sp. CBHHK59/15]|nr:hypothetical protein B0H10DRAFT_1969190 [Mycena sp. CBHHK59/15]
MNEEYQNSAARRRILANVFHACMSHILALLKTAGDYPEQCLATAVKAGECPTCEVPRDELGVETGYPLRDLESILSALESLAKAQHSTRTHVRRPASSLYITLSGRGFPTPISSDQLAPTFFTSFTRGSSSILSLGSRRAAGRTLPPNHNIRLFMSGISNLSRQSHMGF